MSDYTDYRISFSIPGLVALATSGDLSEGQLKDLVVKVASLPPADRTGFWLALRDELEPALYNQLHSYYVRWCLDHSWKPRGKELQ